MLNNVINTVQETMLKRNTTETAEWLDTLAGMTELESLIAIKDQLAQTDFLSRERIKSKINFVLDLDANAYQKSKRIAHNYLIKMKNNKQVRDDIKVVMFEYHRQLYQAYSMLLDVFQAQKKVKLSAGKTTLLLSRYLNAIFMMAKWRYFDDQAAPVGIWTNIHKVIKHAEELSVLNKNVFLYPYQIKETSIAALLKRGFMVDTLRKGNYSQLEVELTDRILKIWATNPLLVNTYKEDRYHFFIKLENDQGPDRVRIKEKFANCRYWKTTRLIDLMEAYLCAANLDKPLREFGLEKVAPKTVILKLFKKLRIDWCAEGYARQRRSEERTEKYTLLSVSHGFELMHNRLSRIEEIQAEEDAEMQDTDAGFTFELKTGKETRQRDKSTTRVLGSVNWWMVDESKSGFAVDFGKEPADWVQTGALIAYTEEGYQTTLSIAEIKSVKKQANGDYRAGFKKLSHDLAAVQLSSLDKPQVRQPVSGFYVHDTEEQEHQSAEFPAFLVDNDNKQEPKLLVSRSQYKRGGKFNINLGGKNHLVVAGKVVAKHNEWVLFDALL